MGKNDKAIWQVDNILKHNKDGSFKTQNDRRVSLRAAVKDVIREGGYKIKDIHNLKEKHINYLVDKWQSEGLKEGTIKNRLAHVRWLSEKIGKPNLIPKNNKELGVDKRQFLTNEQKADKLTQEKLNIVKNENIKMSLRLQQEFGLRKEEALKIQPHLADKGDKLYLKDSWCKGGREREVPIETKEQRQLLNEAKELAGKGKSLIPENKSYKEHAKLYDKLTEKADIKGHGLRHNYAQKQYEKMTGFKCRADGGKRYSDMNMREKELDKMARQEIAQRLGHGREEITNVYLGK